jgi:hypothetical protein
VNKDTDFRGCNLLLQEAQVIVNLGQALLGIIQISREQLIRFLQRVLYHCIRLDLCHNTEPQKNRELPRTPRNRHTRDVSLMIALACKLSETSKLVTTSCVRVTPYTGGQ